MFRKTFLYIDISMMLYYNSFSVTPSAINDKLKYVWFQNSKVRDKSMGLVAYALISAILFWCQADLRIRR